MWLKMYLRQIIVLLLLVASLAAESMNVHENVRQKRTIQYFFDGLFSVLKDHASYASSAGVGDTRSTNARSANSKSSNSRQTSPLSTIAKLSSISTPTKLFNSNHDDDDGEKSDNNLDFVFKKPPTLIQLTLPTITPESSKSTRTQVSRPQMAKRIEIDTKSSGSSKSINREKITLSTSTMAPNQTNATNIESETTTVEPDLSTESTAMTTTFDPIMDGTNLTSNADGNITSHQIMESKMDNGKVAFKTSDRHTTQFFGEPIIVERHRDDQHTPIYMNNCVDINCQENDSKEITPYLQPDRPIIPIISMTIAIPASTSSTLDSRSSNSQSNRNYNLFTLHSIPIFRPQQLSNIHDIRATHIN